jgi:hypothetical protein
VCKCKKTSEAIKRKKRNEKKEAKGKVRKRGETSRKK